MAELVYSWPAAQVEKARKVARLLTEQNRWGLQAMNCPPRRFSARKMGLRVYLLAFPMEG